MRFSKKSMAEGPFCPRLLRLEPRSVSPIMASVKLDLISLMEPVVGFEPTTDGLQNRCSTTELNWPLEGAEGILKHGLRPADLISGDGSAVKVERWMELRAEPNPTCAHSRPY